MGRCPSCGEWNTLVEEARLGSLERAVGDLDLGAMPVPLASVDVAEAAAVPTGVDEFDRVLSGGLVPGSVTLLGGEPGIGKSTLLLQVLAARAAAGHRVAPGLGRGVRPPGPPPGRAPGPCPPQPAHSVRHRCHRRAQRGGRAPTPDLVVVDSIQSVAVGPAVPGERRAAGVPGSVTQVRECADQLVGMAKTNQVATVLVGHVTKDGALAGPRTLEHLVDTVLSFEGDRHHALRLLRAVKHRFGPDRRAGTLRDGRWRSVAGGRPGQAPAGRPAEPASPAGRAAGLQGTAPAAGGAPGPGDPDGASPSPSGRRSGSTSAAW